MGYVSMDDWWTPADPHLTSSQGVSNKRERKRERERGGFEKNTEERNGKGWRERKRIQPEVPLWKQVSDCSEKPGILDFTAPGTRSRRRSGGYSSELLLVTCCRLFLVDLTKCYGLIDLQSAWKRSSHTCLKCLSDFISDSGLSDVARFLSIIKWIGALLSKFSPPFFFLLLLFLNGDRILMIHHARVILICFEINTCAKFMIDIFDEYIKIRFVN